MSYPRPSTLAFLSRLHTFNHDEKVRFLGCIKFYNTKTSTLTLEHNYPTPNPTTINTKNPITTKAQVNTSLLSTTLTATDTQVGEWVHIIGNIVSNPSASLSQEETDTGMGIDMDVGEENGKGVDGEGRKGEMEVCVQAIVLWSAGAVKVDEYERVLEMRLRMEEREGRGERDGGKGGGRS